MSKYTKTGELAKKGRQEFNKGRYIMAFCSLINAIEAMYIKVMALRNENEIGLKSHHRAQLDTISAASAKLMDEGLSDFPEFVVERLDKNAKFIADISSAVVTFHDVEMIEFKAHLNRWLIQKKGLQIK